jgi:hypothetical protein
MLEFMHRIRMAAPSPDDPIPVGLGHRCEVAYRIRRHFGFDQALPFDWIFTPLASIAPMVAERFAHIADARYLEPIDLHRYGRIEQGVLNTRYNIVMRHDFRETKALRLVPDWRDDIPAVAAKWAHLAERWRQCMTSGRPIVFVRRAGNVSLVDGQCLPTEAGDYHDLFGVLRKEAPRCRFVVADANCDLAGADIVVGTIGESAPGLWGDPAAAWKGPAGKWRRLLAEAGKAPGR